MSDAAIPLTGDREEFAEMLDRVSRHERLVLLRGGERIAAVIPAEDLELLEELEDLHDLQEARRGRWPKTTVSAWLGVTSRRNSACNCRARLPQTSKVKALSGGEGLLRWREGQYRLVYRIDAPCGKGSSCG